MSSISFGSCESNARMMLSNEERQLVSTVINRWLHRPNIRTPKFFFTNNSTQEDVETQSEQPKLHQDDQKRHQDPDMQMDRPKLVNTTITDEHEKPPQRSQKSGEEIDKWRAMTYFFQTPKFLVILGLAASVLPCMAVLAVCWPCRQKGFKERAGSSEQEEV